MCWAGVVARCHKNRSQCRNREVAIRSLDAKTTERERAVVGQKIADLRGERR